MLIYHGTFSDTPVVDFHLGLDRIALVVRNLSVNPQVYDYTVAIVSITGGLIDKYSSPAAKEEGPLVACL